MRAKVGTVMRWYTLDEVNQKDSEQNEVDGMKKELIPRVRWCISLRRYCHITNTLCLWIYLIKNNYNITILLFYVHYIWCFKVKATHYSLIHFTSSITLGDTIGYAFIMLSVPNKNTASTLTAITCTNSIWEIINQSSYKMKIMSREIF